MRRTAIVDGPIAPELFQRLESMGFEIVDMNDRDAMRGLRQRLEIELVMKKVHEATGYPIIALRQELSKAEQAFDCNPWPTTRPNDKTSATINFVLRCIEPMPDVKIDKTKDRFSFADHFVGRGKRRNR